MASLDVSIIVNTLKKHWHYSVGLFAAWIVLLVLEISFFAATKTKLSVVTLIVLISTALVYLSWWYSRKPPKTKKGKVGFALSLWCDDEKEAKKIREDFILTLHRLIKSGKTGQSFQFLEIPSHIAEVVIDQDDAQQLRVETRCHFLIYGRIRLRELNNQQHYFLELDGLVAHKPISENAKKELSKEFSELLPRKVTIAKENDLFAFQFTSEWAEVVARYIIGIAAAVSGDLEYASQLYSDALMKVNQLATDFPIFSKLKERIPIRLFELDEARARDSYKQWVKNHDFKYIVKLSETLEKIQKDSSIETSTLFSLNAICTFLSKRNINESLQFLNRIPEQDRDAIWHLNIGFLKAYDGDLKICIRHYRKALTFEIHPNLPAEIEDFVCYALDEEQEKYQLYYCLGFINWKIKGDYVQAIKDFRRFLELCVDNIFVQEKKLTKEWIAEIEKASNK